MLTDFQNSFADRLTGKFATSSCLNIPQNLKRVATLPCEISVFKKSPCSRSNWSKLRVRLSHSKTVSKYLSGKISITKFTKKRCSHQPYKKPHYWLYTTAVTKKRRCNKMPYMISSRSVTDGICLSVTKSKLVYNCLIFVDNKLTSICPLT